jgi:hypothetical protein
MKLVVIIRDPAPFLVVQEPFTYRHVEIELTDEQHKALSLKCTGRDCGRDIYEQISTCFLEGESDANG